MFLIQIVQMHLFLLVNLVLLFFIRDDVRDHAACVSEEEDAHDHEYHTDYALARVRATDVTIADSRHCCYGKVKGCRVELQLVEAVIRACVDPVYCLVFIFSCLRQLSCEDPEACRKG